MEKLFIKNRKDQKLSVIIENKRWKSWLIFITHWLGDNKDSLHILECAKVFLAHDFVIIRFDTSNTFWESEWNFEDATLTNYHQDLEDVINWSSKQDFYTEQFFLLGHSLWAMASVLFSKTNEEKIKSLILLSSPINYELSKSTYSEEEFKNREKKWALIEDWDWFIVKLKWSYMEDKKNYNLLEIANTLDIPTLIIIWEQDDVAPYEHQKLLFDKLPSKEKELHIIEWAPHTFREQTHLDQVYDILDQWIKKV